MLRSAQESFLTTEPNPTYLTAEVKIDSFFAHDLLQELDIGPDTANDFGKKLQQAIVAEIASRAKPVRESVGAT